MHCLGVNMINLEKLHGMLSLMICLLFFLGIPNTMGMWFHQAMATVQKGLRPHTRAQYVRQFKLFVAFMLQFRCKEWDSVSSVLCFLEFPAGNALSFRVVNNYVSALNWKFYFKCSFYKLQYLPIVTICFTGG